MSTDFILGKKNRKNLFGLEDIDPRQFKIEKPVVLIWGGTGTDSRRIANGYASVVESLLGEFAKDADIISINYAYEDLSLRKEEEYVNELVFSMFKPLVGDKNGKLDVDTACKNMRNVTVFAHCYGTYFMEKLENKLKQCLAALGYSANNVNKILSQMFVISYGARQNRGQIPSLDVLSMTDEYFHDSGTQYCEQLLNSINNVSMSEEDRLLFSSLNASQVYDILRNVDNRCYVLQKDNKIRLLSSNLNKKSKGDHGVAFLKRLKNWKSSDSVNDSGDCVARCIGAGLCNSVANSMLNNKSEKPVPFNVNELRYQLEEICKKINNFPLEDGRELN